MLKITQQSLMLTRGDTAFLRLIPKHKDDSYYQTEEGDRCVFRIKTQKEVIEIECTIDLDFNMIEVSILPEHTIHLRPGMYKWEAELITADDNHYTFIADQPFIIGKELEIHGE